MTLDDQMHNARVVSSVAATIIALACGTNYVYSAWGPQLADRLHLSATESQLIGLAGNLGMYLLGVPIGMFVDSRGPRPAVLVGAFLLGLGYLPLERAYDAGNGSVAWLSFVSFLTGLGGCMAFAAAVKTSALNWPHHRGTATAFPLAAFGLSAFFFSLVSSIFFPGNPGKFLLVLSIGTFGMVFTGFFFLRVLPHASTYRAVPADSGGAESQEFRRSTSSHSKLSRNSLEPGTLPENATATTLIAAHHGHISDLEQPADDESPDLDSNESAVGNHATLLAGTSTDEVDENQSLLSQTTATSSLSGEVLVQSSVDIDRSRRVDLRGWNLLMSLEFWQMFVIMGILSGIGLMTINNIGNDAAALWKHYDDSINDKALALHQQLHVSILSLGPAHEPNMVSRDRCCGILAGPNLRPEHRQPAPSRFRFRFKRPRLRLPLRRVPVHHGRVLRHSRPESKLGLYNARPRHIKQYLQLVLRPRPRRPFGHRGRWEKTLRGGHRVLSFCLRRDALGWWARPWCHTLGHLEPGEDAAGRG
ncbi:putative major facilitator superfamily transporter [Rosellinia necatrix]|uniref:Putative major facilitator superfamily transporter n=1 Tax=Rosellinia necatrix TaxID=77044 RepID=A0A1W2TX39_ROSNE|nr:putative major facilitator superfamily transporter [Rosellinia necatrix]